MNLWTFNVAIALSAVFLLAAWSQAGTPPTPVRPLDPSLVARSPVDLLPGNLSESMAFRDDAKSTPSASAKWSTPPGALSPVLRVECFNQPKASDHVSVMWTNRHPVKRGDVMLARFLARAEYARQESGEAAFELAVIQRTPEYTPHVNLPLTAGPDWALIEVPFSAARDGDAGKCEIQLRFGIIPQAVEIASFSVLNFGDRATTADLPQTRFTYKGREAGAAWREAALARIEKIRTAPIDLRVIDAAGRPIPNAKVEVRLVRPAFQFGSEVDASVLVSETPEAERYKRTAVEMFDTLVIGNGMKWPKWSGSPANRAQALAATDWMESQGFRMRGHCLVWPGNKFSPRRVQQMPPPKTELSPLIQEHIRDLMTATKGRISSWDVINEMIHERDYFEFMPESEAAEWFKVARQADPRAKLFINDYGMLNSRKSPDTIAKYVDLVRRLLAAGAPIDGMGIQGHVGRQVRSPEDVLLDLDLLAAPKLELQVTEFEVNTTDEELQADYTRDFLIALYSHPSVTGFTKWGFWESRHWKPDGAMFRKDWSEKPNARVWRDLVRRQWLTSVDVVTNDEGGAQTRGHLGDYEFTVTAGERTARQMRQLTAQGESLTLQFP